MILGLEKDANFKFEKDWEFFTNMFKKQVADNFSSLKAVFLYFLFQALNWTVAEKLEHLNTLDVEDHIGRKSGDPIWR